MLILAKTASDRLMARREGLLEWELSSVPSETARTVNSWGFLTQSAYLVGVVSRVSRLRSSRVHLWIWKWATCCFKQMWSVGGVQYSPLPTIDLKVNVRQNDNTNYIDGSINEVTLSPLNDLTCFCSVPSIGRTAKPFDRSIWYNEWMTLTFWKTEIVSICQEQWLFVLLYSPR